MDARARLALEDLARAAVHPDLDALSRELAAVRREVWALRAQAGFPSGLEERRERVAELRAQGLSATAISRALDCHRSTITRDLEELDVPAPATVRGVDGRTIRMRS